MEKIETIHCLHAIKTHEFPDTLINTRPYVALILTQSWCPQWSWMRDYLSPVSRDDTALYFLEYDHEPFFQDFMSLKEQVWGNAHIPYVRYYRNGRLVATGNYTGKSGFEAQLYGAP